MKRKQIPRLAAGTLALVLAAQTVGVQAAAAAQGAEARTESQESTSEEAPEVEGNRIYLKAEEPEPGEMEPDEPETEETGSEESGTEPEENETEESETGESSPEETEPEESVPEESEPEESSPEENDPAGPTDPIQPETGDNASSEPSTDETDESETTEPEVPEETTPSPEETTEALPETIAPVPETTAPVPVEKAEAEPELTDGEGLIPAGADPDEIKELLAQALISNWDELELDAVDLEWEYYCTGKSSLGAKNDAWGSIEGFETTKKTAFITTTYTHPALAGNADGDYQLRLLGTDKTVTFTKYSKLESQLVLKEEIAPVSLIYDAGGAVDYDALREAVFEAVIDTEASVPEGLTADDVEILYYAEAETGSVGSMGHAWMPLEGGKKNLLTYPAMTEGTHSIQITFRGVDDYANASVETELTVEAFSREETELTIGDGTELPLIYSGTEVDYDAMREAILEAVSSNTELTQDNTEILYYATAVTGNVGGMGKSWVPLEGKQGSGLELTYPAISEGTHSIRISFKGTDAFLPAQTEGRITITDGRSVAVIFREGPYEIPMSFNDDLSYNYEDTARAIFQGIVESMTPEVAEDQIIVEYNVDKTGITNSYKPLSETDLTGLIKFGPGKWKIRISWPEAEGWKAGSFVKEVTMTDSRLDSAVALKSGVSFTYNMDADVLKQEVFNNVIDWENSALPVKDTLTIEDFVMEYKAPYTLLAGIEDLTSQWKPFEGSEELVGYYPNLGAGEQQIRVSYKGDAQYRPSENVETTVTVNKAKARVTVYSNNIFAGDPLPHGFVSIVPGDKFDVYTIYAGTTSNVTTALYLDLPDRITESDVLKLLDPVVQKLFGKSFTQMMNDGVTVGELRQLFNTQELLELLDQLNINTGTFGQILSAINNLPSILDSLRISFGVPNRAGLYTVIAVSDSPNYNTGVGMGMLLVRMRSKGVKLNWNQELPGYKISAEEAKSFDFGVTLSNDGDVTIDQSNVHYLYSGFTSRWRVYSSTTTPPSEPGSYVMTVVTLGGNYQAAPVTRSFQITK